MQNKYKRLLSLIIALTLILLQMTIIANAAPLYTDVDGNHWAYKPIKYVTDAKLFAGYSDGSFQPNKTMSRAEAVKVIVSALSRDSVKNRSSYRDINISDWYAPYVEAGKDLLPFTENSEYFRPNEAVTRGDAIFALIRSLELTNVVRYVDVECVNSFKDSDEFHPEIVPYFSIALQLSIISGYNDNTLRTENALTRAEFATLLYRSLRVKNGLNAVG